MTDIDFDKPAYRIPRGGWGRFIVLGILLVGFGLLAFVNVGIATVASILTIGVLMVAAGISHFILAFRRPKHVDVLLLIVSGMFYLLAGVLVFINPVLASSVLTLMIAASLLAGGMLRVWVGFRARPVNNWGLTILAGVVTILLGLVIASGWPINSLFIIGMFLAIDLLIQGSSFIAFGLLLRRKSTTRTMNFRR